MPELGRLTTVPLRNVWNHEASDFTPWLLSNADDLGEALGMDLVLERAEHRVGSYSLDLIGSDQSTDELVIVENQLEATDHGHLGQLLTYAAGTDAVNVVWLAGRFRQEHRAALDWLNQRTDVETRFFGVEVSAVRIGDSVPAPLFRVVAEPNDWNKQVRTRAQASDGAASERAMRYVEFWDAFLERLHDAEPTWTNASSGPPENWFTLPTGASQIVYYLAFTREGVINTLRMEHPDSEVNDARFSWLEARREDLEAAFAGPLEFDAKVGRKSSSIGSARPGSIEDLEQWDAHIDWLIDGQRRLRTAMDRIGGVQEVAAAGLPPT